ncbi:MAG: TetR/AcrR family transcriptional regulator [Pseudomonadota bacterium]
MPVQSLSAEDRRLAHKEQRREDLIKAALDVFSRVGFASAKLDDVAEEAGVSKGTIYLYFDSKEALFEDVVRTQLLPVIEQAEARLSQFQGSAADMLRQQLAFMYNKVVSEDRRVVMRLIIAEGPNFPALTEFYYKTVLARGMTATRKIIEYGVQTGEFRQMGGDTLALNVMAGAVAAGIWAQVFQPHHPLDLDVYSQTHIDLILGGLCVRNED